MIEKLEKHHIGIVIFPDEILVLEKKWNCKFHFDVIQGVHVCFRWNEQMNIYEEYITKEGRALNYIKGFHHICYNVNGQDQFQEIHDYIVKNKHGFRLTFLEKSGSKECNQVAFYNVKNLGIIELNVLEQ